MASLREIQQAFACAAVADDPGRFAVRFVVDGGGRAGADPDERLDVYRNNVLSNYREALRAVYPVLERLVGRRFFDYTADRYARANPSSSGDIHRFGAGLHDFLASFEPAAVIAYLPDTARLEWAMHTVFHGADHAPLEPGRLAKLAQCNDAQLRFSLHPGCRLLCSRFPVHRIWELHQEGVEWDDAFDVDSGGVMLLVRRRGFVVELVQLEKGEFVMLQGLAARQALSAACADALQADPSFAAAQCMHRHIVEATLVDFSC